MKNKYAEEITFLISRHPPAERLINWIPTYVEDNIEDAVRIAYTLFQDQFGDGKRLNPHTRKSAERFRDDGAQILREALQRSFPAEIGICSTQLDIQKWKITAIVKLDGRI